MGRAGVYLAKHLVDGALRDSFHRMTEMLEHRFLREGALRPEKCHLQRLLQRQACGHDLAKQARHLLFAQRPLIARQHPA